MSELSKEVTPVDESNGAGQMMTLLEHMLELKDRLVRVALALVVWGAASFVIADDVLQWLLMPMRRYEGQYRIIATRPTTTIGLFMKISLFTGAVMAMPWIVHQVLVFVLPALTRREKRTLFWIIPGATLFFLFGALFAYLVMVPAAIPFLLGFWSEYIEQNWMVDEYIPFVTGLVFWVGVSFETPLIMAFVARMGVVTAKQFLAVWKYAVVAIAVLAAFITPTPDPFNMSLVMLPLISLYFLGVLLSWLVGSKKKQAEAQEDEEDAADT
jgi:sec-independent protein translocase protein TatC